ncbi:MAG: parallel beta-helix domain-containing protein, partial [Acidobacteriota bacterium]
MKDQLRQRKSLVVFICVSGLLFWTAACSAPGAGKQEGPLPPADVSKRLQEELIKIKPGGVITLPAGKFQFDRTLSLSVPQVTIRGQGIGNTTLSFKGQTAGSAGMLVKADDFTIEDLAIEDAAGDALKIDGGTNITIRRVRVEWTGGPQTTNGPYGLYPVNCKNVLIEESVAIGASDAGIYVGQSDGVIIRRNRAEKNVAAIEVENTRNADVYDNTVTGNTGGVMVFNLPDLPVQGGGTVRVFNNKVIGNNTPNFAPKSQTVYNLATGTGMLIMAVKNVEIFNNEIRDNGSASINIVSYLSASSAKDIKNPSFNPYTASIYIHDNRISGGGKSPDQRLPKWQALGKAAGGSVGDIIYDGIIEPKEGKPGTQAEAKICLANNGDASFLNFDGAG